MTIIKKITTLGLLGAGLLLSSCGTGPGGSSGAKSNVSASQLRNQSAAALNELYAQNNSARVLGQRAKGVLVFPQITKGGLGIGGAHGNGVLYQNGQVAGYYNTTAASYGLQAGLQKYSYALMMMDDTAMASLNKSGGWSIASTPNLVVVDSGVSGSISSTTIQNGTYAFFFGQKGLMGGLSLEGSKITRIAPQRP